MASVAKRAALADVAGSGQRFGRQGGTPGVKIEEVTSLTIASLAARRGAAVELATSVQSVLGVALPAERRSATFARGMIVWTGPEQWLVLSNGGTGREVSELAEAVAGFASVTDQSDSRAVLNISGPRVRDTLAKGVMLDLHPRAFQPGDTAVTLVAHISAQVTLLDIAPTFQVMVPRSFAHSFWDWLTQSAAEFGAVTA